MRVDLSPLPPAADRPVTLVVDDEPVDPRARWLHHKTTRRRTYSERAARHPDADDVLLMNDRGEVTESTVANLAVRLGGTWFTPPLSAGCLPGHLVVRVRHSLRLSPVERARAMARRNL